MLLCFDGLTIPKPFGGFQLHFVHLPFAEADFSNCIALMIEIKSLACTSKPEQSEKLRCNGIPISLGSFLGSRILKHSETHLDRKIFVCVLKKKGFIGLFVPPLPWIQLGDGVASEWLHNDSLRTLMASATLNGRAGCRSHHQLLGIEGLKVHR